MEEGGSAALTTSTSHKDYSSLGRKSFLLANVDHEDEEDFDGNQESIWSEDVEAAFHEALVSYPSSVGRHKIRSADGNLYGMVPMEVYVRFHLAKAVMSSLRATSTRRRERYELASRYSRRIIVRP